MKTSAKFCCVLVSLIFLLCSARPLQAKILMVAPHPDDDVITSSGIIAQAVARGEPVHVVFMTNGDATGAVAGYQRQGEAVAGESILGVPENNLIFLGYPDAGLSTIYSKFIAQGTRFVSPNGISATYGNRGLGRLDYHTYRFGAAADYNRANILTDLQDILTTFQPDHIMVTSEFDAHPDHSTTYQLVKLAVVAVNKSNPGYVPTIHKTMVHWNDGAWPPPMDPTSYFTPIPNLTPDSGLAWSNRESLDVPLSMQSNTCTSNPKCQAIEAHASQGGIGSLGGYLHKDEYFFVENVVGARQPPTVNAGPSQTLLQSNTVQLDGRQSFSPGGAPLSYQWVQRSGPPVTLSKASSATPTFVTPNGLTEDTALTFDLVVSDGNFTSLPDTVDIQVTGTLTVTPATAPSAVGRPGGPFAPSGATYTLQNSGSSTLTWGASKTQPWVTLSANGGNLAPGATAPVTVSINANAGTLAVGSYKDTVTFTNTTNDIGDTTRAINLAVTTSQTSNIAPLATVTASSENSATGQTAVKAVDGVIDGYPGDYTREWASAGQGAGAWLNLAWPASYSVSQVVLYDRPNLDDNITAATLAFSDGSSITAGPLNDDGTATTYSFPARVITGLRMTVTGVSSSTSSVGLSEIQVYGTPASVTQYTLTSNVTPSGAGSVTANPIQPGYPSGTQIVLTAAPNSGYSFSSWSGGASGSANPLTVTITGNLSITANFSANSPPLSYTLTYSAGANGTITGTTRQSVSSGGSGTQVTAVATTGYHFVSWSDGVMTAARTDKNVTANISVTASFAINSYTLTYSADANGTISGTTPQTLSYGGSGTQVTAVATTGYHFVSWSDGVLTAARTDSNATANITVTANFAATSLLVTGSVSGGNGTISCTSTAVYGGSAFCTMTPNAGYHLFALTDNNTDQLSAVSGGTFTISAITDNHVVNAVFGQPTGIVNQLAGKTTPDLTDALAVLRLVLNKNATAAEIARADIAPFGADGKPLGNGKLDIYDVIGVLRMILRLN